MTVVFIKTQNNTTAQVASQQIHNLIQILNSVEKNKQVKYSVVESNRVHLLFLCLTWKITCWATNCCSSENTTSTRRTSQEDEHSYKNIRVKKNYFFAVLSKALTLWGSRFSSQWHWNKVMMSLKTETDDKTLDSRGWNSKLPICFLLRKLVTFQPNI